MRQVNIQTLSKALQELRGHTLNSFECYLSADKLTVPCKTGLNPPVWELGHLAWFQEYWIARNLQRAQGLACDLSSPRKVSLLSEADAWFDSAKIAHSTRWELNHLTLQNCLQYAAQTLAQTLELLHLETGHSPALYFYWLVLQHEAMHLEASAYMAQSLGLPFKALWQQNTANAENVQLSGPPSQQQSAEYRTARVPSQTWKLGSKISNFDLNDKSKNSHSNSAMQERPFCFDNELIEKTCAIQGFEISLRPVNWAQYLDFVNSTGHRMPNYIRQTGTDFETEVFGSWLPLNKAAPAVHLSWADAQAYCAWAKCRLPSEAEWDCAAHTLTDFEWGRVWEWTQDTFAPYEGFVTHPYTEYSAPWFGTHKVLRGASHLTHSVLRHVNYRNFFTPERDDIYSGFRTCTLSL
jgi:EgtB-related family protein